jgi:hypothetical protein
LRANDWQPVTVEGMYAVLALLMLLGIMHKFSLQLYFSRSQIVATPVPGSDISLDKF